MDVALGVLSFLLCAGSMFCLFLTAITAGKIISAPPSRLAALSLSLWEVLISTKALDMVLDDFRQEHEHQDRDEAKE